MVGTLGSYVPPCYPWSKSFAVNQISNVGVLLQIYFECWYSGITFPATEIYPGIVYPTQNNWNLESIYRSFCEIISSS